MTRKILALIIITLICSFRLTASSNHNFLLIEEIKYQTDNSTIEFPFFTSKIPEKVEVANQINKRLQHILFYDDDIINKDNKAEVRVLQLGINTQGRTEILSGLNGQERVVLEGIDRLSEGKAVQIVQQKAQHPAENQVAVASTVVASP